MFRPTTNRRFALLSLAVVVAAFALPAPGYAQVPVPAVQESITVSTSGTLTEETLDGSEVTVTLAGRTFERSIFDIRDAVSVSGIAGVSVGTFGITRASDTRLTIELDFNGDFDEAGTLTFTVGAGAIAAYNGAALTRDLSVPSVEETVDASTASPLTEATLDGSVVTLTLSGRAYESSIFDVRDGVSVSGIAGVSVGTFGVRRVSDTKVTVELDFSGNIDSDGTLTFTVGSGAIANYNGAALTADLTVSAGSETVTATTTSPLTEATLDGSVVTLTLSGATYERSIFDVRDGVSVSGIAGVSVGTFGVKRISDTVATVELEFNGNIDSDGTLTFTVGSGAIANYNGSALTADLTVSAGSETVTATTASPLTEATLDGSVVTLTLSGARYESSVFDVRDAVSVSGISGVSVGTFGVKRISDTVATVELEFNGNIDGDGTLTFTVGSGAIANYNGSALTADLAVTAGMESVTATTTSPLTEATLNGSVVTLTLTGRNYARFDVEDAVSVSGISGVSVGAFDVRRVSDKKVTVELSYDGNIDSDGTLTFTVGAAAIANYNGDPLTATLPVSAGMESVTATTTSPLTEATLDGSVVTLTLAGAAYTSSALDIRDAVSVSGIAGASIERFGIRRVSDTVTTAELEFNGNMDADGTLTFTVGADAIANYNGDPLTATLPVTAETGGGTNQIPTFSEGASTTRSFAENTPAGLNIGSPVRAMDGDGGTLSYSLAGADAASFTIVTTSGQLQTKTGVVYDYEVKNRYEVTVRVSDGQGGSATIAVTINLTDVSETPPAPQGPCATGSAVPNPAANPWLVSDCNVLLEAKDPLRGTGTLNWSENTAIATWDGVTISGTPQRVTNLRIWNKGLNGTIPAGLSRLTGLNALQFGYNQLTGTIPAELGTMTGLNHLVLPSNRLTGTIPEELKNLTNLRKLALQINGLTGNIPSWVGTLRRLQILNLYENQLTGAIPTELGNLTELWQLLIFGNRFTGTIPAELGNLSLLQEVRLDDNRLTGSIPSTLAGLTRLGLLYLAGNSLTGCVPPALRDVSQNDLDKLNLPDCSQQQGQKTADFNGDGIVNFADFFDFVDAFGTTDAKYDLDDNGIVNFADFFEFVDAFGTSG
ncbi:MAG: cadherin domain-containing protein [Gemmatimonadota bacterium]|nr:cadherin domain-containing protein [Gemmatimonadota bacterium]